MAQSFAAAQSPVKFAGNATARMPSSAAPGISFTSQQPQGPLHARAKGQSVPSQSPYRSFNDSAIPPRPPFENPDKPQIYTAAYSGIKVYEMEINGVACMRRRHDGWLNATQILKVAGVDKGKRTKVLEKEVLTGEHEKVQGGYGKYQGTWISYERGREFCRQYGVEDILQPLLDYDRGTDGETGGNQDTPTKEQAMAANRKRFYSNGVEQRNLPAAAQNGTFFSSISPMSSVALSAMEKAARLNSSDPRASVNGAMSSQRPALPTANSQQSIMSDHSFNGDVSMASAFARPQGDEPPRKRMRTDADLAANLAMDISMQDATPTEPNESFLYGAVPEAYTGPPITLSPLPAPENSEAVDKRDVLLDLFADHQRVDYTTHPALTQLSAEDYDMPLDASANTALHWAATLARVSLVKLLIQKGANMWRGNAAGQSPLISAVLVSNCSDHSCFPHLLELLSPLIEVRDAQGRTILHHIAVACGIKGRAASSKYYLESLLEYLVRNSTQSASGDASQEGAMVNGRSGPLSLMKFLSTIVNAQDKGGNTALNLVARIGNRSIIQQLLEIRADPTLPNHKGVAAKDFGVGTDEDVTVDMASFSQSVSNAVPAIGQTFAFSQTTVADADTSMANVNALEEQNQDVIKSISSLLMSNLENHKSLLSQKMSRIDALTAEIQELSAQQGTEQQRFSELQAQHKLQSERRRKIENLSRLLAARRSGPMPTPPSSLDQSNADERLSGILQLPRGVPALAPSFSAQDLSHLSLPALSAIERAYSRNNTALEDENAALRGKSIELEALYRRVIGLCTGVAEDKLDALLPGLVAAVESEGLHGAALSAAAAAATASAAGQDPHQNLHHGSELGPSSSQPLGAHKSIIGGAGMGGLGVGRVREFLALVDGVNGASGGSGSALNSPLMEVASSANANLASGGHHTIGGAGAGLSQLAGIGGAFASSHQGVGHVNNTASGSRTGYNNGKSAGKQASTSMAAPPLSASQQAAGAAQQRRQGKTRGGGRMGGAAGGHGRTQSAVMVDAA